MRDVEHCLANSGDPWVALSPRRRPGEIARGAILLIWWRPSRVLEDAERIELLMEMLGRKGLGLMAAARQITTA